MVAVVLFIVLTIAMSAIARIEEKFREAFSGDWMEMEDCL